MLELKVFVGKLCSVNRLSTGAVVVGEVTTLAHESRDNPVKGGSRESEPFLTGA
jgi:hypothetical protein